MAGSISVKNGKIDGFISRDKIYIGRANKSYGLEASPLSNPFKISEEYSREDVIELYRQHLWKAINRYKEGQSSPIMDALIDIYKRVMIWDEIELTCWCSPLPCHGDVIVRAIAWLQTQDWFYQRIFGGKQ